MIFAYFIGGSMDLTKRAMRERVAPPTYYAAMLEPFAGRVRNGEDVEPNMAEVVSVRREKYRCLGEVAFGSYGQVADRTYVYAYDGIE
jgi:hypothetical protein